MNQNKPLVFKLPSQVHTLWRAQQDLVKHYSHTGLRFTLDGRLVGDIAEAIALENFDLKLPDKRQRGVDALTPSNATVQIKATGQMKGGAAFTSGVACAQYLLFFGIDYAANTATLLYNGLEEPVRNKHLGIGWTGTKVVSRSALCALTDQCGGENSLPLKKR